MAQVFVCDTHLLVQHRAERVLVGVRADARTAPRGGLQDGPLGNLQVPDYALCLLGTARAQSHFDKAAAIRSYQQLLDIWKNADSDFRPAQDAKRELLALQQ